MSRADVRAEIAIEVLLVQDTEGDFRLLCEGFRQFAGGVRLLTARSAGEAHRQLGIYRRAGLASRLRLIVLGSQFAAETGGELLSWIKNDPELRHLPVIVFLPGHNANEVNQAYLSRANCVVRKCADLEVFFRRIQTTLEFWVQTTRLPGPQPNPHRREWLNSLLPPRPSRPE